MKKIVLTAFFLSLAFAGRAQEKTGRWVLGGSLGFDFGESQTSVVLSPQLGYRFGMFTLGGGMSYSYYKWKDIDARANYFGMNAYGQFAPIPYFRLFVQPEVYRRWSKVMDVKQPEEVVPTLLVGGGLVIPVVQGGISMSVYYDVIQNKYSPYNGELMYSVGYTFYF